jgi:hypothetical protein
MLEQPPPVALAECSQPMARPNLGQAGKVVHPAGPVTVLGPMRLMVGEEVVA